MNTRVCTKCGKELPLTEFHKDKTSKFGVRPNCKKCFLKYVRQRYHTPEGKRKSRDYRLQPIANMRGRVFVRYRSAMSRLGIRVTKLTLESVVGTDADTLIRHIESTFIEGMSWNNMEKWDLDHATPIYIFDLELNEERLLAFHYTNLTATWSSDHTEKTYDDMLPLRVRHQKFIEHIEQHFLPGMNWDNKSEWFIDTKYGPKAYDLLKPTDRRKFFHYRNFIPKWIKSDNEE